MQTGISTASLFGRYHTEDGIKFLKENGVSTCEVFLESYSEYTKKFGKILKKAKGDLPVHSIHTLTTQFEPTLYSLNDRAMADSYKLLENTLQCAQQIGAKYYTFHGVARVKRTPITINFERVGFYTQKIIDLCAKYGVTLTYENVHWAYYNYVGFFNELRKRVKGLKGTLDIKQARQSNIEYKDLIKEMGEDIVTVHLSDVDENGKMCLPGKGITDFGDLFTRLNDVGFDGALLLEVYQNDYKTTEELFESLNFVTQTAEKIFHKPVLK